ncbi:MAG: hypothetical protein QXE27_06025 [Thermoplasmata archaeon]
MFQIPALDNLLESGKRKRILLLTEQFQDALFLIENFLGDDGHFVVTKPVSLAMGKKIDWYSQLAGIQNGSAEAIVVPADPVQFFSAIKKMEGVKKLFFHLTPVLLLHEKETVTALIENLCSHCESQGIAFLVLLEKPEIFEETIGEIRNSFDYSLTLANGKLTFSSLKKPMEDLEFLYFVRESEVVLQGSGSRERLSVRWNGGKNLYWLPGSELLLPGGVEENTALFFSSDARTKEYLIEQCIADALLSGKPCIFVSGENSSGEFARKMRERKKLEVEGIKNFVFVDWFSCSAKKVTGVEDRGREILVSRDIVYLGVAIDWALKKLEGNGVLVLDCINAAAQNYSAENVCSFLATSIARAKRKNYSTVSFSNPDVIGNFKTEVFAFLHDCHIALEGKQICVRRTETLFGRKQKFAVAVAADVLSVIPEVEREEELSDEEIARVLRVLDELLGTLPEEKIAEFAMTEEFKIYEKLLKRYRL